MAERAIPVRVSEKLVPFNGAVRSGEFRAWLQGFMNDAVMSFAEVPVGALHGRDAIRAGFEAKPPDGTTVLIGVESDGDVDNVGFRWSRGGTGTMTLRCERDLVAGLEVSFDDDRP